MESQKFTLTTPVLFLVFNRLDTTKKVFAEIRKAKPKQLFIASDGPRDNKNSEKEIVESVRKYILDNIDWKCEVKTLFRNKNLGCRGASNSAITWFFDNIEQGIILEDDDVPSKSFFRLCQELLEKYKDNDKIMSICGTNFIEDKTSNIKESYFFSKNTFVWGFATWKKTWKNQDLDLKKYKEAQRQRKLKEYYPGFIERRLREKRIKDILNKKVKSWAIPYDTAHQINKSFSIIPRVNLIENIGFKEESTHTKENKWDEKFLHHRANEMNFPLKHPKEIKVNKKFDREYIRKDLKRIILKRLTW